MPIPHERIPNLDAPVHGINFEELKVKAAVKGFKPVYIDRMREQAVMASLFSNSKMAQASHDEIRVNVAKAFSDNLSSVGGFSEAYKRERAVVKSIGRQLPERKFDEVLQIMKLLAYRLDDRNQATAPELDRARKRFLAVVSETVNVFSAFNMDAKEVLRRVEREPMLVKHAIPAQVKAILEGLPATPAKSTLGSILTRPITLPRLGGR